MDSNCVIFVGFLCFLFFKGEEGHPTPTCLEEAKHGFISLNNRNAELMKRFEEERFGSEPPVHRYEFPGIQEIEEHIRRLDECSDGSYPRSNYSSHAAGNLYRLHFDIMLMFRVAFQTIKELESSIQDGTSFTENLADMIHHMHRPVRRLKVLVDRYPGNSSSFDFTNFSVEFETTSSGQVCSGECLHRQSYHILQKYDYFLDRAEFTFTSIIFNYNESKSEQTI